MTTPMITPMTRVAIIGIFAETRESVARLNQLLHEYADYIIGRMGLPYREKKMSIISIVLDAPQEKISTLSGKLGRLEGVSVTTMYAKKKDG